MRILFALVFFALSLTSSQAADFGDYGDYFEVVEYADYTYSDYFDYDLEAICENPLMIQCH